MSWKKHALFAAGALLAVSSSISICTVTDVISDIRKNWLTSPKPPINKVVTDEPFVVANNQGTMFPVGPATPQNTRMPTPSLAEVLRLDITVEWILQRWPRVATGLPELQLQGYRVPLVSGTSTADVAGSLTYYFNARQQVQRITFCGTTGDPTVLANILGSRYGFTRRLTNDPGMIVYEAVDANNHQIGSLKIRSASVVSASQPRTRFMVDLVIDRTS